MDELIEIYGEEKKQLDGLKINYLFGEDIEVCNYVSRQLSYFDIGVINYGNVISLDELVEKSIEEIRIFGDDIYSKIQDITTNISIHSEYDKIDEFTTVVGYQVNSVGEIITDTGMVDRYIVPKKLYELSVYHLAHEHIHALKDTNYSEYQDSITLGEIIPLFLELIMYNPNELLKKEVIRFRLKNLLYNKKIYKHYDNLFMVNCVKERILTGEVKKNEMTSMCEFLRSRIGCYFNSFYYALILYNMYKVTPKKILNLVNKVLKHEMTTLGMLDYLGLYGDIRGEIFEKELRQIRKLVK